MIIVRSFPPEPLPLLRNYVVDVLPRFVMSDYDYRGLEGYGTDVLLLEWDIAVSREDLATFIGHAKDDPGRVLIAPYRCYQSTSCDSDLPRPIWVHRRYEDGAQSMRQVVEGDEGAHLWGMGMCYLPRGVLDAFTAAWPGHFNDATLSGWHNRNVEPTARLDWDVRPVHLHYPIERTPL